MSHKFGDRLIEAILIVISILVAFAIDAWWQERNDRVEEHRVLSSLQAEFQANLVSIPVFIEAHRASARYTTDLIDALQNAGPDAIIEFGAAQTGNVISQGSSDPHSGALDAVLQSGEMRFIQNPQIRERLASWPQMVKDATENEVLLRTVWNPVLQTALARRANLAAINDIPKACWNDPLLDQCQSHTVSIPYDTEVIGLLLPIQGFSQEAARELENLVVEAEAIVEMIDHELETLN
jgi:hypothetical protein